MRTRLTILGTLLAVAVLPAHASEQLVEFIGHIDRPSATWLLPSPVPDSVNISFDIDTLSGTSAYRFFGLGTPPCLGSFGQIGMTLTDMQVTAGSQTLWASSPVAGDILGVSSTDSCLDYTDSLRVMDASHGLNIVAENTRRAPLLQTPDLFATVLAEFPGSINGAIVSGDFGRLILFPVHMTISSVPEPGTLWLLAAGLAGIVLARRKQAVAAFVRFTSRSHRC
jgi:hypothetical protein